MGMGYRRAWFLITSLQQGFNSPLIETVRGGNTHGGAAITELGKELGGDFTRMKQKSTQGLPACQNGCRLFRRRAILITPDLNDLNGLEDTAEIGWER